MESIWRKIDLPKPGNVQELINLICTQLEDVDVRGAFVVFPLKEHVYDKTNPLMEQLDIDEKMMASEVKHFFVKFDGITKVEYIAMITTILTIGYSALSILNSVDKSLIINNVNINLLSLKEQRKKEREGDNEGSENNSSFDPE